MNVLRLLERTIAISEDRHASEPFQQRVAEAAAECGVSRARLWTYANDVPARIEKLVLVAHAQNPTLPEPPYRVGLDLELSAAHVRRSEDRSCPTFEPVVVNYPASKSRADADTARLLGITGDVIEIPIFSDDHFAGIFALEPPEGTEVSPQVLTVAQSVGFIIGQRLALDLSRAEDPLIDLHREQRLIPDAILHATLAQIVYELNAAIAAVFEWNIETNSLTKIDEIFNTALPDRDRMIPMDLPEQYRPDEYLTGKAWLNESVRYIYSFQGIGDVAPGDIAQPSLRWHEDRLGTVRSVLYDVLVPQEHGNTGSQYLVRIMNHVPDDQVPFVASDTSLLGRICEHSTRLLIESRTTARLAHIIRLSSLAVHDLGTFLSEFANAIKVEGISGAVVIETSMKNPSDSSTVVRTLGSVDPDGDLDRLSSTDFPELVGDLSSRSCAWTSLDRSPMGVALASHGYLSVLPIPFSAGTIKGLVLVPSGSGVSDRSPETRTLSRDCQQYLEACAELLARSLEIRRSEQLATGALQALGYLGHEMGTPMMQLGSLAVKATSAASDLSHKVLRQRAIILRRERELNLKLPLDPLAEVGLVISEIKSIETELIYRSEFLASLLSLAPVFALRSNRTVRVSFRSISTATLLEEAIQRTHEDPLLKPDSKDSLVTHPWQIDHSGSVSQDTLLVCDRYFLSVALASLLRNAVKYSVPRPGTRMSRVLVNVQAQRDWLDILVTNHGIGISDDERHAIFEPFTQGTNFESVRAVKGMGLGLYLCRVLASAHGGEVRMISSRSVDLDDPVRVRRLEGFETVFLLRTPRSLAEGVHEVSIDVNRTA
jgi:signal transduction histidine kinase